MQQESKSGWLSNPENQFRRFIYRVVTICMHILLHTYAMKKLCILDEDVFLRLNKNMHPNIRLYSNMYIFIWFFEYVLIIAYTVLTNTHYMRSHNPSHIAKRNIITLAEWNSFFTRAESAKLRTQISDFASSIKQQTSKNLLYPLTQ